MEAIIGELNEAWNAKDVEGIEALFASEAIHEDVTAGLSSRIVSAIRDLFAQTWAAIPDVQTRIVRIIAQGEFAAWGWTMTATHTGDFPNLPATGRKFTIAGVSILQVGDGKILSQRDDYDQASFLRRAGALPPSL